MKIVIAEDSAILRDGLTEILRSRGHEIVAAVEDGEALIEAVNQYDPDVSIVDIRMPPTHTDEGLRAAIRLRRADPSVRLLVFSQYVETRYASDLFADGAEGLGYLLKDRVADVQSFVDALTRIAAGQTVLDPEVVSQLMGAARDGLSTLSPRERETLELMAEGMSNAAIAETMVLTAGAVEKNVTAIFTKLGLPPSQTEHRRVLAVLRYLQGRVRP